MPNRIIKESICSSENIDNLEPMEEILFYRLMVNCDDYGLFDGRSSIIRAKCFPLKVDKIKEKDIDKWLQSLVREKLVTLYENNNKQYLKLTSWEKHQQTRATKSKFPKPDDYGSNLISSDINCNQVQSNAPVFVFDNRDTIFDNRDTGGDVSIYKKIIDYLNQKLGTKYKHTSQTTKADIKARINQGFTYNDFVTVIDKKHAEWGSDTKMSAYLRPETLFSNKFESYLNQIDKPKPQQPAPEEPKFEYAWQRIEARLAERKKKEEEAAKQ